jgi:hypothetical protein
MIVVTNAHQAGFWLGYYKAIGIIWLLFWLVCGVVWLVRHSPAYKARERARRQAHQQEMERRFSAYYGSKP